MTSDPRTTDIGLIVVSVTQLAMLIITPGIDGTVGSQGVAGEITSSDSYDVVEIAHITVLDTATNLLRCNNTGNLTFTNEGSTVDMSAWNIRLKAAETLTLKRCLSYRCSTTLQHGYSRR